MRDSSKLPKTFLVHAETPNGKKGYVRLRSYIDEYGAIKYGVVLVKAVNAASRYVTLDNAKLKAKALKESEGFKIVQVIDELTKKVHNIH